MRERSRGMASLKRVGVLGAVVLAGFVLASPPATAQSPPRAKYDCVISGILFGTLTIKGGGSYTHRGTKGKFSARSKRVTFPDKIKGWRLKFRGGTLAGVRGRWYRTSTPGVSEIALRNPIDDFESIYCTQRR
jgi:hypothetical protein